MNVNDDFKYIILRILKLRQPFCSRKFLSYNVHYKLYFIYISAAPDLAPMWVNIHSLYMNVAQHVSPQIRFEGIHGFLISATSLPCETRPEVYELLCKFVKQEHSALVRWVAVKIFPEKKIV